MALNVCVLASGSSGNCIWVSSGATAILVDAGLSAREIERRLAAIGRRPEALRAICLSHEHTDHTSGMARLHTRYGPALYANAGTIEGYTGGGTKASLPWNVFTTGAAFAIGDLTVEPFAVPHDAYEPVGFVISSGGVSLGIATDLGTPTSVVRERLKTCRALVLEMNHEEQLLHASRRPWPLKQRILGRQGHLSNRQSGELLESLAGTHLERVFLAHLSAECNRPELAERHARERLAAAGHPGIAVSLTYPDRVSELWSA